MDMISLPAVVALAWGGRGGSAEVEGVLDEFCLFQFVGAV
jgi:hypothetical protein